MKLLSTFLAAFLATTISAQQAICWKDGGNLIPSGHCVLYDKDGQQTDERYVCRKVRSFLLLYFTEY